MFPFEMGIENVLQTTFLAVIMVPWALQVIILKSYVLHQECGRVVFQGRNFMLLFTPRVW